MLMGIRLKANPTSAQKDVLSQWMGVSKAIWNMKCDEDEYFRIFARKFYPVQYYYYSQDQKAAHFKNKELTPWLSKCPSQIIRNSSVNWYQTQQNFIKGVCGRPKRKGKSDKGSVHITKELFKFVKCDDGVTRLFIGSKTNNIGYIAFKSHRSFKIPKSLYIKKERGQWYVSFCYDDHVNEKDLLDNKQHLDWLKGATEEYLQEKTVGIDRGVAIPVQAGEKSFDFTGKQKKSAIRSGRYIKRLQRNLARQKKGSNRRNKTKNRIAKHHAKCANIRKDFCHKTSHDLVNSGFQIFVLEDLKTSNMTRRPKAKQDENGRFVSNKAKQKAGLNRSILSKSWFMFESFLLYKSKRNLKAVFKVNAAYTSQECANCGHIHKDNRKSQSDFVCVACGHTENADQNASMVIKKRAINLIKDSGTELSKRNVLQDIGRGDKNKTVNRKTNRTVKEASKKTKVERSLEAVSF